MILDSSAIVAIVLREPGFEPVLSKLTAAEVIGVGTPTLAETGIVLSWKLSKDSTALLRIFLQEFGVVAIPFGETHWREAVSAYVRYGRHRRPAGLKIGDCMTYATARLAQRPLLCLGNDFAKTDLALA